MDELDDELDELDGKGDRSNVMIDEELDELDDELDELDGELDELDDELDELDGKGDRSSVMIDELDDELDELDGLYRSSVMNDVSEIVRGWESDSTSSTDLRS